MAVSCYMKTYGCIKICPLHHTLTLFAYLLDGPPGQPGAHLQQLLSGSFPGEGSHCTASADSQPEHTSSQEKHGFTSTLSRTFSRIFGKLNPRLNVGGTSQYEQFPLAHRLLPLTTGGGRQWSEGIIPSCRALQASVGASSPRETPSAAAVTMALRDRPSANTRCSPIKAAPLAGQHGPVCRGGCFTAACNCASQQRPLSVFSLTDTPPVTFRLRNVS